MKKAGEKVTGKREEVIGRCVHADRYGACEKAGFKYKGLFCDAAKCKDFEEKAEIPRLFKPGAAPPDALKWQTCGHSDADGRCANPESNGQGGACKGCEDYGEKGEGEAEVMGKKEEVISLSRACAYAREGEEGPDVTAEDIARCYLNAVCGVLHVIRFGCMMLVKESCLKLETAQTHPNQHSDDTLKKWLRDNVPDVNYKTAMGFKATASKVCEVIVCQADVMLRAMNPDPKALPGEADGEALISVRERLLEIIHGKNSLHAFRLWLTGHVPDQLAEGPEAEDTGKADEIALDAARKFARSVCDALEGMDARKKTALRKALAKDLRERFGAKRLVFLAQVVEEACGG